MGWVIRDPRVHIEQFFSKTLHWLLISFSLHITACAVEQFFGNTVYMVTLEVFLPVKKVYEQIVCGCLPSAYHLEHTQSIILIHQFVLQKMIQKCNFQL